MIQRKSLSFVTVVLLGSLGGLVFDVGGHLMGAGMTFPGLVTVFAGGVCIAAAICARDSR